MRLIGLLGGMSWESTAVYYRLCNEFVRERLGGLHSARVLMYSVDFAQIERMQTEGRWEEAGAALAEAAKSLEAGGAEVLVLCTNTMHKVADAITAEISIPFLHLADVTADAVRAVGAVGEDDAGGGTPIDTVGLLGTAFTMEQGFYRDRLAGHGLRVLTPGKEDRALVHRVIYEELCLGIVTDESRAAYRGVIERLAGAGAQGVVLGCTEIELLVGPEDSPVPVFATTRLHARAAVEFALAPR